MFHSCENIIESQFNLSYHGKKYFCNIFLFISPAVTVDPCICMTHGWVFLGDNSCHPCTPVYLPLKSVQKLLKNGSGSKDATQHECMAVKDILVYGHV